MARGLHIKHKQDYKIGTWLFWLFFLVLLTACVWYGYRFYTKGELPPVPVPVSAVNQDVDETPVDEAAKAEHSVPPSHPKFLSIDKLGVHQSRVLPVGVKDTGELDSPLNIFDTGWHNESATPGTGVGAVLIDGHNGGPTTDGVFKRLPELRLGDEIVIERGDGEKFTYEVKENKSMSLEEANNGGMQMMAQSADIGKEGLNIITCVGRWIPKEQTYSDRQMLRAVLKS